MQIYIIAGMIFAWAASLGVTGYKAYEFGQGECRLEVVQAAQRFQKRARKYRDRINDRQLTRARGLADKEEGVNDIYEDALDVIAQYDLQLGKKDCYIPAPIREAIGKIR